MRHRGLEDKNCNRREILKESVGHLESSAHNLN